MLQRLRNAIHRAGERRFAEFVERWPWETDGHFREHAFRLAVVVLQGDAQERALERLAGEPPRKPVNRRAARNAWFSFEWLYGSPPSDAWYAWERIHRAI